MLTFAHISDLHIDLGDRATTRAERLVATLTSMPDLDAVLVTGDIADHGTRGEYVVARDLLARIGVPVLVLPGNHDIRKRFGPGLLDQEPSAAEINQLVTIAGTDFLLLDSVIPGQSGGLLSETTLTWLKTALSERDSTRPALVAFHHPPAVLHIPFIDAIRQTGEERLAEVLRPHPEVAAVICGHAHTAAVTTFAGRPLVVGPGCVSTTRAPVEAAGLLDLGTEPGYALHVLDDEARLVTHFRTLAPQGT